MMNHKFSNSLRRSALHIPATNQRAMAKAQSLPADVIIFDFEDAVAPCDKGLARPVSYTHLTLPTKRIV